VAQLRYIGTAAVIDNFTYLQTQLLNLSLTKLARKEDLMTQSILQLFGSGQAFVWRSAKYGHFLYTIYVL
jgi:hypothetical protein